jgi:hypothetical protein
MRFTLGKMFLAVGMLALACAGLTYRTYYWASAIFALTVVLFLGAAFAALSDSRRGQVVGFAFALAGGTYLALSLFSAEVRILPTSYFLGFVTVQLGLIEADGARMTTIQSAMNYSIAVRGMYSQLHAFNVIGHCVFSWLFAILAAWFAGRMYDRREQVAKEGA